MTEIYRLRLDHYICDGEDRHMIEAPLVIQQVVVNRNTPVPVCLNRMLDMMRDEVLKRTRGEEPE